MTPEVDPRAVPVTTFPPPSEAASPGSRSAPATGELASWNQSLNATHAMAAWRERSGRVVRAIEARRRRLVADAVRHLSPGRVIDVGCEDGWMAEAYVDAVDALTLVDLDPATLQASELRRLPNVDTAVADATSEASLAAVLARGGYDVIVLSALLEHVPHPRGALDALIPFLVPGGHLVIYVPADRPILAAKQILKTTGTGRLIRGLSLEGAPGHLHVFSRKRLRRLLQGAGTVERLTFDPLVLGYLAVVRVGSDRGAH